jgi:transcriptional regulator with XRE-family HTH domain
MAKKTAPLLPSTDELLHRFGDRLRLARLRRQLTAKQVAERAGMAPMTLRSLERGGSGVTMGAYLAVMQVLGIEKDIDLLAKADPLGRELQDARLPSTARTTPGAARQSQRLVDGLPREQPASTVGTRLKSNQGAQGWVEKSGFANAETLAGLLDAGRPPPKRRR